MVQYTGSLIGYEVASIADPLFNTGSLIGSISTTINEGLFTVNSNIGYVVTDISDPLLAGNSMVGYQITEMNPQSGISVVVWTGSQFAAGVTAVYDSGVFVSSG